MFQLRWLLANLKGQRIKYCIALCLSIVCRMLYVVSPYIQSRIIDTFITADNARENLALHRDLFITLLCAMVGVNFLRTVMQYSCNMYYEVASQGMVYKLRTHLFRKIENQDMAFYDKYRTGDLMTRLTGDLDMVRHMVSWVIKGAVESVALFAASMVYFFTIDVKTALCLLAMTPFIFIVTRMLSKRAGPAYRSLREKDSALNTAAQENISGNRTVKAFAREEYEKEKFRKADEDYRDTGIKAAHVWLKFQPMTEFLAGSLSVILLLCGGTFIIRQELTMGEYVAISSLLWAISNPMIMLGSYVNDFHRFNASAKKVIEIYHAAPLIVDRVDAKAAANRLAGAVEFRNVSFEIGEKTILDDISFSVEPGQSVAIMGETGSGKTSLINLIPRFFDATKGKVLIDGVDVKLHKLNDLRRSISVATQDVLLYSDTIDGNIAFGDSDMSEDEVHRFAELSAASEFIENLPDGYDTIVGERGVGLSGGQKQRISLARALAVRPSILILDDTTSAVDMETESHIQHSLTDELDFSCTKIIIAQRISSARNADKIIILKDGKIAEQGTHDELVAAGGYYSEIFALQNSNDENKIA